MSLPSRSEVKGVIDSNTFAFFLGLALGLAMVILVLLVLQQGLPTGPTGDPPFVEGLSPTNPVGPADQPARPPTDPMPPADYPAMPPTNPAPPADHPAIPPTNPNPPANL